jgi:hypothetical protein
MVIVKATADSEAGVLPSEKDLAEMGAYNEELVDAGVMLDGAGLHASTKGPASNMATKKPRSLTVPSRRPKS